MGTPTQKRTKSSARRRASHFALHKPSIVKCSNCGTSLLPHRACPKCGYYKGEKKITAKGGVNK
ncbi:MAG: 50S ribosomal protein L32 [Candidatus Komeilibacteria bacterium CG11_big_fil_rev_8_21_14_0_20_36_20]|uniref:Large ribosomal subunit protein bL32 n=1 Tax=Candidatus Komeilibacteria bacterium CG11_big_fil_rev_8_21_14_0_20_36_20 TaxID=1974477 RepID=A0A2H0NCD3_9BACT|nr:MAG: 50S ribosomal protein L32 [Candidatus Komeilibacteria bacterium CG11_big_fil_rev_8_21_14_0_20_36_20]PIR81892.1 MAG: 50S ribosomal protein L32 [Candidatus Komeilibacteria bacterium CG10_big_fil_rev_8_21_14_0_10_36_65]PJC55380.1 MAG: 50S ribosomal protein L32 [Candidatus Komeilibacteria bacterium CG_4_9_14_0_2_um_filter_36_13]